MKTPERALQVYDTFVKNGVPVKRVIIDGRRIEVEILDEKDQDEFDGIDMAHGQKRAS